MSAIPIALTLDGKRQTLDITIGELVSEHPGNIAIQRSGGWITVKSAIDQFGIERIDDLSMENMIEIGKVIVR